MDNAFPLRRGLSSDLTSLLLSSGPSVFTGEFVSIRFPGRGPVDGRHGGAGSLG